MLKIEEFEKYIEEEALAYAYETVVDPDLNWDVVETIKGDFIEGAMFAYKYLTDAKE